MSKPQLDDVVPLLKYYMHTQVKKVVNYILRMSNHTNANIIHGLLVTSVKSRYNPPRTLDWDFKSTHYLLSQFLKKQKP